MELQADDYVSMLLLLSCPTIPFAETIDKNSDFQTEHP
jgi:hypothetical protein